MEFPGVDVHQRCALDPEMSTPNVGAILPAERGPIMTWYDDDGDVYGRTRNAFELGSNCEDDAGGDADNRFGTGRHQ